jgi:putative ABC transport system substrate-binding protein
LPKNSPRAEVWSFTADRDLLRRAAAYVDKILKGTKPSTCGRAADKIRVIINMKTAKALGLTVPPSLLVRADEVIE